MPHLLHLARVYTSRELIQQLVARVRIRRADIGLQSI
jgi:hypothetical protein